MHDSVIVCANTPLAPHFHRPHYCAIYPRPPFIAIYALAFTRYSFTPKLSCALVNHLLIAPSIYIAHAIAILLHDECAICDSSPDPLVYAINHTYIQYWQCQCQYRVKANICHTILVMAISCKGQCADRIG